MHIEFHFLFIIILVNVIIVIFYTENFVGLPSSNFKRVQNEQAGAEELMAAWQCNYTAAVATSNYGVRRHH
jgi:hypothetical protein